MWWEQDRAYLYQQVLYYFDNVKLCPTLLTFWNSFKYVSTHLFIIKWQKMHEILVASETNGTTYLSLTT